MKKTAALCAVICLLTVPALAYENLNAGYSVKDKNPFYKLESSKIYTFSDVSSKNVTQKLNKEKQFGAHIVNYYTAKEMSELLGEAFSTEYFEREYEKLALLERSQLDMRTVPSPMLDLEKYDAANMFSSKAGWFKALRQQFDKLKPTLRIDKLGGRKVITLSYLYKQQSNLVAYDLSFVSANDRLYLLSTYNVERNESEIEAAEPEISAAPAEAPESVTANDDTSILSLPEKAADPQKIKEALGKLMQLEQIDPASLDKKQVDDLWNAHKKFLSGFKTMQPVTVEQPLRYDDTIAQKTVALPQDWFYGQMQMEEKEADICLTFASSMPTMQKIAKEMDYMGMFLGMPGIADDFASDKARTASEAQPYSESKHKELFLNETRKALNSFDAMLMTIGIKIRGKGIGSGIIENTNPIAALEADRFLSESLERLKKMSNNNLALKEYDYQFDFADGTANVDITADVQIIREFTLKNWLSLGCKADGDNKAEAYAILFTHKPDFVNAALNSSLSEWHF